MLQVKKNFGTDPILKWEIVKKCHKYKAGDKYYNLWIEEKLVITSYNIPNKLLNQRSEILNVYWHKKSWFLVK